MAAMAMRRHRRRRPAKETFIVFIKIFSPSLSLHFDYTYYSPIFISIRIWCRIQKEISFDAGWHLVLDLQFQLNV